jgi:hypothetical protein
MAGPYGDGIGGRQIRRTQEEHPAALMDYPRRMVGKIRDMQGGVERYRS